MCTGFMSETNGFCSLCCASSPKYQIQIQLCSQAFLERLGTSTLKQTVMLYTSGGGTQAEHSTHRNPSAHLGG